MKEGKVKKHTILRFLLALSPFVLGIYSVITTIDLLISLQDNGFSGGNDFGYSKLLLPTLLIIGSILFVLNKKMTDYISFAVFIFLIGGVLPFEFVDGGCISSEYFNTCVKNIFFVLLLTGSPLIYLLINFIKDVGNNEGFGIANFKS